VATETVHLVNREHLPFTFAFDRMALGLGPAAAAAPGGGAHHRRPVLDVQPMTGTVPPNGRVPLQVTFCPREEKFHNFNLACSVRKKPSPLGLNVKGEGYAVHCKLQLEDKGAGGGGGGEAVADLKAAPASNVLDFGMVHLNERAVRKLTLANTGKFNFDYLWERPSGTTPMLQITGGKLGGSIRKGEKLELEVEFRPVGEVALDGTKLTCTVAGRDDYVLSVFGRGVRPGLQFSFTKHDFGPCFITPPGAPPLAERRVLQVTNRSGEANLSLTCTFQRDRALDVRCDPVVLEPGRVAEVPFLFTPRSAKPYIFSVPFLVNGSYNVNVIVQGEGVAARCELANPSQASINFGQVQEGADVGRQLRVVNRSKRALEFQLVDPGAGEDVASAEEGSNAGGLYRQGALAAVGVSFFPAAPVALPPRGSATVDLRFAPTHRVSPFKEDLLIRYGGVTRKLTTVAGACAGLECALETDAIPFGVVCAGSRRARRLNFENSGDLPARYRWQESTFGPHFRVAPLEGVVAPMSEAAFEVTFQPRAVDDDIRVEGIRLFVEGHPSLALTLTGVCVPQPADTVKELRFKAPARQPHTQTIRIDNPTDTPWFLAPLLTGEHWSADEELRVPPKSGADYEVVYRPKSMTHPDAPASAREETNLGSAGGKKTGGSKPPTRGGGDREPNKDEENMEMEGPVHEGSVFFALPDGGALLYNLKGVATPPPPEGRQEYTTAAKKSFPVHIEVKNWLDVPQKFAVQLAIVEGDPLSTFVSGTNTIDLDPYGARDYALKFYAYKEGPTRVRATFTNERTGEYLVHELAFTATAPEAQETLRLEAPVRSHARQLVTVDNPLPRDVDVGFAAEGWWGCSNPFVHLRRVGEMAGTTEGVFEVDYRPLLETGGAEEEAELWFECAALGRYVYRLRLQAQPPAAVPTLRFEAPLGGSQQETFVLRAFNAEPLTFDCAVGKPLFFEVGKTVAAPAAPGWEGAEVGVRVVFEPEELGEVRDTLTVASAKGGTYACQLVGVCTPALPQGPFPVASGQARDLPFRNVFNEARDFTFVTDDPRFTVGAAQQSLPTKSSKPVTVKFQSDGVTSGVVSAKLFVSCAALPDLPPWVYYLEGTSS